MAKGSKEKKDGLDPKKVLGEMKKGGRQEPTQIREVRSGRCGGCDVRMTPRL